MPITLHINHESRQETLKHYYVIYRPSPHKELPLCFNPARDSLYLSAWDASVITKNWFSYLNSKIPGGLKAIKYLEIRDVWHSDLKTQRATGSHPRAGPRDTPLNIFLRQFEGLELLTLTFAFSPVYRQNQQRFPEIFENMLDRITGGMLWAEFLGFEDSFPEICFRPYEPVYVYTFGIGYQERFVQGSLK